MLNKKMMDLKYLLKFTSLCTSISILLGSCSLKSETKDYNTDEYYSNTKSNFSDSEDEINTSESDEIEDGTYSATVDYYNSETGHNATYTLDVDVENREVVQVNFPNGGWLDDTHIITASELDEDGECSIDAEDGKTYDIQIED